MKSREFKFRVWDNVKKEFWDRSKNKGLLNVTLTFDGKPLFWTADEVRIEGKFWPKEWIIQQYTNLKDSKDKEIYEGDILKVHGNFYDREERETRPLRNVVVEHFSDVSKKSGFDLFMSFEYPVEVIGNIFENPELLK